MQQLIKITSVPMRTMSYTQNARLVSSDSVDMERRKALARQMSFHRSAGRGSGSLPMQDIAKINRTFSRRAAVPQGETVSRQQSAFRQAQTQSPAMQRITQPTTDISSASLPHAETEFPVANTVYAEVASATAASIPSGSGNSAEIHSTYTAERGSVEMRVARGDLTFLPPMVMTIVTQYPELHFEYLGDFNYVPPRDPQMGGNINLAT